MTDWSLMQRSALDAVSKWMKDPHSKQVFYLGGYAGTGKTTLAKHLTQNSDKRWLFAALTGKAAHVLRQKGCLAQTIHSLIYKPNGTTPSSDLEELHSKRAAILEQIKVLSESDLDGPEEFRLTEMIHAIERRIEKLASDRKPMFALWENSPINDHDVEGVVIDECSMVDDNLGADLESFGKKILVLGDPGQLPPVGAAGRYTRNTPDFCLTEIHRQAADSGVLRLATAIRRGEGIHQHFGDDARVIAKGTLPKEEFRQIILESNQTIVGRNQTRQSFNARHRSLLGRSSAFPEIGDRLVCLRNDHTVGLFNGSQWIITEVSIDTESLVVDLGLSSEDGLGSVHTSSWLHHMIGEDIKELGWNRRDLMEFDYGYTLTCHKSQGSQWPSVVVFDESAMFGARRRWLYTAVTRAERNVTLIT